MVFDDSSCCVGTSFGGGAGRGGVAEGLHHPGGDARGGRPRPETTALRRCFGSMDIP